MNFIYRFLNLWYYKKTYEGNTSNGREVFLNSNKSNFSGSTFQFAWFRTVTNQEKRGNTLRRVNWVLVMLVLVGFVIGRFIGTFFEGSFLNYGQSFGLSSPMVLDLGFFVLTFGLTIQITIASVIGVVIALVVYRFIR